MKIHIMLYQGINVFILYDQHYLRQLQQDKIMKKTDTIFFILGTFFSSTNGERVLSFEQGFRHPDLEVTPENIVCFTCLINAALL